MNASSRLLLACLALPAVAPVRAGDASASITAIAALTDPAKIATLKGERAANDRLHKVMAALEAGRIAGVVPSKILDEALRRTDPNAVHVAAVKEMLLCNFELCQRQAVFTPDNLARLQSGRSPLVTSGSYIGQTYDVDHVIPVHEFPALGKELANLLYVPAHLNRSKGADIKQRALDLGTKLAAAGILTPADVKRLHEIRVWGDGATLDLARTGKVNVNTASAKMLETLPGIGPKTAKAIIAARPLKDLDALDKVPGMGAKTIEGLKELVSF